MAEYASILDLAREHGYSSFTELQELAFREKSTYCHDKDLFIIGETSSGKTLIPLLIYQAAIKEARAQGRSCPKMLFSVPYRALAAQKTKEFRRFFENENLQIVQSTGEFRQDDELIQKGKVDVAIIISEKAFMYEARTPSFVSQYDFFVIDEIGLINDSERGIRIDFLLTWAKNQKINYSDTRIIALGTPFYDWSAYIDRYGFSVIKQDKRPVLLEETTVVYGKNGIDQVIGDHPFLYRARVIKQQDYDNLIQKNKDFGSKCQYIDNEICPFSTPCRTNPALLCSKTNTPCFSKIEIVPSGNTLETILLKICRNHLQKDNQILIFINDRARVMNLCKFLFDHLKDQLPSVLPAADCKERFFSEMRMNNLSIDSDDVFGIMEHAAGNVSEEEYYQAFLSGVAFHSAALPNELRTFVETKFLDSRDIRIVCSTETLAFGVNSTVDVVVVADIKKHNGAKIQMLTLNEYQNYAGRAGRLRAGEDPSRINGYVYTLVRPDELPKWKKICNKQSEPQKLYSLFHRDSGEYMPFFLLNLLPATGEDGMTADELLKSVEFLPQDDSIEEKDLKSTIKEAIGFLVKNNLAIKVRNMPAGRSQRESHGIPRYCLTSLGKRLRGFIISCDDYEKLVEAIQEYLRGVFLEADRTKFLFKLLQTRHAETGLNSIFSDSQTRMDISQVRLLIKRHAEEDNVDTDWVDSCVNIKILFILASLLDWCSGESSRHLYRQFGIHYALLSKLAEGIAYLIEITKEIVPTYLEQIYLTTFKGYQTTNLSGVDVTYDAFLQAAEEKQGQIHNMFVSLYYGINTRIVKEFYNYLVQRAGEPHVAELLDDFSLRHINPVIARRLRRIVIRYKFFSCPAVIDSDDIEAVNNFNYQKNLYISDIKGFGSIICAFFAERFPDIFEKQNGGE